MPMLSPLMGWGLLALWVVALVQGGVGVLAIFNFADEWRRRAT